MIMAQKSGRCDPRVNDTTARSISQAQTRDYRWPERKAPPQRGKDYPGRKIKMKPTNTNSGSRLF